MTLALYELVGRDSARPFSPHCWKARMALAHKGLAFETRPVSFTGVATVENGTNRTVPVLRDGESVVQDSFAIAQHLDAHYPDRPSLFGGEAGEGVTRFVESWSQRTIHPAIVSVAVLDIHETLDEENRTFFRAKREAAFGRTLEEIQDGRGEEKLAAFRRSLEPLRATLKRQPFIGGETPRFADHIVFSPFQWLRIVSTFRVLEEGDPVAAWVERCLDLYEGAARRVPAA
ncbi:glutathione S-transferase family protein [Aureimonas ureilytica]|uniref:glutathione S-transferase family protein n=1 Tax=Aureimonas ureilytica TaxID=401562 RepID=UPI0004761B3F|nr:glutathione S-transferase family protein [Aureimonas ureilytica]